MTPEARGLGRFSDVPRGIHYTCVLKREHIARACVLRLKMQRPFTFGANRRRPAHAADWWRNAEPVVRLALTSLPRHICLPPQSQPLFWLGSARHVWQPTVRRDREEALQLSDSGNLSDQWSLQNLFPILIPLFLLIIIIPISSHRVSIWCLIVAASRVCFQQNRPNVKIIKWSPLTES